MHSKIARFLILSIVAFTLAGCAIHPTGNTDLGINANGWQAQKSALLAFSTWQARGKLAYRRDKEAFSATVKWQHSPQRTQLRLSNTLGITLVNLDISPTLATLKADGKEYTNTSAHQLLLDTSGWDIPLDLLNRWIKALPNENDLIKLNADGFIHTLRPSCLRCRKWHITYDSYARFNDLVLPTSLTIRDITHANAFIKLRLSSWQ